MSNTKTIARNAGWYGFETFVSSILTVFTSIAIARTLGPSKMGYLIYVFWIATIVASLGGMGVPATTQKYMAEFLGKGDRGTARYIYFRTLLLQMGLATLATIGIVIWVLRDAGHDYVGASVLVALSIWPAMVNFVSAQANVATEELSTNMPASVISIFIYFIAIAATVVFKWGVTGVGASFFSMRVVDFLVRFFPTMKRILAWDASPVRPFGLSKRMLHFAWQSVASMIVAMIVWDRSEFFLLKHLCADIRQVAFYSVAFSLAERLLIGSAVLGSAISVTIFAQYGRDKSKLSSVVASSFRYLALTSIPVHAIATALAVPILLLLYGNAYKGAALVVTLAPLLCMPKAFLGPAQSLLQCTERQSFIIAATVVAGIVDIGVAWFLIPTYGAVGACIGNGVAQVMAIGIMWAVGVYLYKIKLPWLYVAKISFVSALASFAAYDIAIHFSPLWGILWGGSASLIVVFSLFYLLRVLEPEDIDRFDTFTKMLPGMLSRPSNVFLRMLARPKIALHNCQEPIPEVLTEEEAAHK